MANNDLVIPDATVSRHHALLKRRFGRYRLIDLESTNGTFVNGRRVRGSTPVSRGDELRFGRARFVFLQSPTTRELRKWISLRTILTLLAVIFVTGFALTEHLLDHAQFEKLSTLTYSRATALANLENQRKNLLANLEEEQKEANQPPWLRRVNYYRHLVKMPPVFENPSLSHAVFLHSRYLVKYELRTGSLPFAHTEDPNAPYYTPEGLRAAQESDLAEQEGTQISGVQAVDGWMKGPFHRLAILNPETHQAGLSSYTQSGFEAIGLDLPSPSSPSYSFSEPIKFPPPESNIPLAIYEAGEWPDPLASCPGYTAPTGLPITLQLGASIPVPVGTHAFSHDGTPLEHCVFDATTYTNPDPATQNWARDVLKASSAVMLIPRNPFTSGEHYTVSISIGSKTYEWSFTVR